MKPSSVGRIRFAFPVFAMVVALFVADWSRAQWAAVYYQGSWPAEAVAQTADGGYVVAGGRPSVFAGRTRVMKVDASGNILWQILYLPDEDYWEITTAHAIQQTDDDADGVADDGFIVVGQATFYDGARMDIWVLKLDPDGNVTWSSFFHGGFNDNAYSVEQTADGGYVVAGYRGFSAESDRDLWVLKLDDLGVVTWQKTYDAGGFEGASSIQQTSEGGYVVAGWTQAFGAPEKDYWILKLDGSGGVTWQRTYGGVGTDEVQSIHQTTDGGYVVAGFTDSFGAGGNDFWILKIDPAGEIVWQKTYGGTDNDEAYSIRATTNGGFVAAGTTELFGVGLGDFWVLKLDADGSIDWQNAYDIGATERAWGIRQTTDGGYVVAGGAYWSVGDYYDNLIVKLKPNGAITQGCNIDLPTTVVGTNSTSAVVSTTATGSSLALVDPGAHWVSTRWDNAIAGFVCREENCTNGVDDDGDGLADCLDPECCDTPSCQGIGPCTTLTETVSGQDAAVSNIAVVGNLGATIEFTSFEMVTITTGPFAGKGFSRGIVELTHEGTPYSGTWRGMAYLDSPARKIHLKGAVTGGVTATVDGVLTESVADTGVYDRYQATWSIGRLSATSIAELVDVTGDISYTNTTDYPSTVLYYLQESIETADSGHNGDSMNTVTTHLRVVTQANPYAGEGFSTISYTAGSGLGRIWTHDTLVAQGLVQQTGLSDGALFGVATSILDQTVVPAALGISIERIDGALPPMADLQVKVWGPRAVSPGELLDYQVEFENMGEGTAYGVYFTDMLDGDLDESTMLIGPVKDVSSGAVIAPPGTYDPASRIVSWFVGAVAGHAGGYADLSVGVRPDTPRGSEIINFGTVYFPSVPEETRTNAILSMVPIEICDDGIDNDGDGLIDCLDPECSGAVCVEVCNDGQDNDGDGLIDCTDPDCPPCPEDCAAFWRCVFRDGFETGDTALWDAGTP